MSELLTRPLLRRAEPQRGSRVPWLAAVLAAAWSLVAGLALATAPVLLGWLGDGAEQPAAEPMRIGAAVWLAAHRVALDVDGVHFQLAPGLLTMAVVLLLYRAARWAAHLSDVAGLRSVGQLAGAVAVTYSAGAATAAVLVGTDTIRVLPLDAGLWSAALALPAAVVGAGREANLLVLRRRLPADVRSLLVGAAVAVAGLVAVGAALVTAGAFTNSDRIGAFAAALEPGVLGGAILALASALLVPNLAIWAVAYALGPGFAVGAGTSVAPAGSQLGLVPAMPALAALPTGPTGTAGWLLLAGPVVCGGLAGAAVQRRFAGSSWWRLAGAAAGAAAVAAAVMVLLAELSGGSAGSGRLAVIGPAPWHVGLVAVAALGVPAVAAALGLQAISRRRNGVPASP